MTSESVNPHSDQPEPPVDASSSTESDPAPKSVDTAGIDWLHSLTVRRFLVGLLLSLGVALLIAELSGLVHIHAHLEWEAWPAFYASAGFVSYVGLVLVAKQLRKLLMRPSDYYDEVVSARSEGAGHDH